MAEAALFSLASKVLTTIVSPPLKKAYERARSIKKATEDLEDLKTTLQTIQAILIDAEKQQEDSIAVKNWIDRVRDALYDADDLFDEVIADDLLNQQRGVMKKVRSPFSKLKANDSIAKRVKDIRKCLDSISKDMTSFDFVKREPTSGMMRGVETAAFVDPDEVIGRDEDKKAILDYFEDDSSSADRNISVIAIVGIGGMGKSTLAQLVYNDSKVSNGFRKRWWACINNISDKKQVSGKIFQSMSEEPYHELSLNLLQSRIREYVSNNGKFLLVLDDFWDESHAAGRELRSLLSSDDAKGSMIFVTTRSWSVAKAMDADKTHVLKGLSEDASWKLFRSLAFTREQENDTNWIDLGKKILRKCANVPLAIKSIASLLYTKSTMQEWLSFENEELSKIDLSQDSIIPALKLSYLHLSPNLKPCFAYCSLFPKNYEIARDELIGLWIAQGYVESSNEKQSAEEAGHGYFMELVRRFFFEKAREDIHGEVCRWKMHDLIHDLTQNVAGMETSILNEGSGQVGKQNRHLSVVCGANSSWNIQTSLLIKNNRIRSFLFVSTGVCSLNPSVVDQLLTKFNFLRSLCLKNQGVEDIPCSIGELKHLRYLDLSNNNFSQLPDSITKLVNLLTLDIFQCGNLQKLPGEFRKLVNLRQLDAQSCFNLRYMPSGFEELTCLQNLYCFKVGKATRAGESSSRVDALAGLNLKGYLQIEFDDGSDDWNGNECIQLPTTITELEINYWPWMRIPSVPANLVELCVYSSSTLKHLPPLRHLPRLKILELSRLDQLEYIEDDDDENESEAVAASANLLFFPCLEKLLLYQLPRLKGWSRHVEAILAATRKDKATLNDHHLHQMLPLLPVLSALDIFDCEELKSMPLLPRLQKLQLHKIPEELVLQLLSPSLHSISHSSSSPSSYLEHLETISISNRSLSGFPGVTCTSLRVLELESCKELKHLYLTSSQCDALEVSI